MNTKSNHKIRRETLSQNHSRTLFLIHSGMEAKRSHSVHYRFKSYSDFTYLSGLNLAEAVLAILGSKVFLFWDAPQEQIWGEQTYLDEKDRDFLSGICQLPRQKLEEIILSERDNFDRIAASLNRLATFDQKINSIISFDRKLREKSPLSLCDSSLLVGTIRQCKEEVELQAMREAGARSSMAHRRLMTEILMGKTEREISNWIEAQFLLEGMQWTAYETIVGTSHRTTTLHARATDRVINEGDLILIDAAGEWQGYCADITRTLPAGKKFTSLQSEIYETVLEAQKIALQNVQAGTTLKAIHDSAIDALIEGLVKRGNDRSIAQKNISHLMPHKTSHWIGMDVHDPSPYIDDHGNLIRLRKGMCFTVEPGLYFRDKENLAQYFGIGVRIEDDVLVTENGYELLCSVPKEREEIEELRARADLKIKI